MSAGAPPFKGECALQLCVQYTGTPPPACGSRATSATVVHTLIRVDQCAGGSESTTHRAHDRPLRLDSAGVRSVLYYLPNLISQLRWGAACSMAARCCAWKA